MKLSSNMMSKRNVVQFHSAREVNVLSRFSFQRKLHVTRNLINRLGLETELDGHTGCVNCLEWNQKGDLIASGSDDLHIILWDPFNHKKLLSMSSGHSGNLFTVKFLPNTNDRNLISGAADFRIMVHDIVNKDTTMTCSCHGGRVKRIAVAPNVPFLFWSAAEDGIVMQFDLRMPHHCSSDICNSVFVNLIAHLGRHAEAKCVAVNPLRPELIAVGANDPFVRLYDRRMIKTTFMKYPREITPTSWENISLFTPTVEPGEDNLPPGCVSYFVAGHLPLKQDYFKKRYRTLTSTYIAFSPDGKELLANLGGEQIYLFDIHSKRKKLSFDMLNFSQQRETLRSDSACVNESTALKNGMTTIDASSLYHTSRQKWSSMPQTSCFQNLKHQADEAFDNQEYTLAISLYSKGVIMYPKVACLYGSRAAAYIKRAWDGDNYASIRDCYTAMKYDPDYLKAYFHLAQSLYSLSSYKEALECLTVIRVKFPEYAKTKSFELFETEVKVACFKDIDIEKADEDESDDELPLGAIGGINNVRRRSSSISKALLSISEQEKAWRASAYDYEARFCGHCNTTTDIKEANFFGSEGQFITAGSDDGSIFIWDRVTSNIVRILRGDESIVNCLQPHPSTCLLATSGIDPVVRLWGPKPEDGSQENREIHNSEDAALANQRRMNADPLEVMLINMGYRMPGVLEHINEETEQRIGPERSTVQCRTS